MANTPSSSATHRLLGPVGIAAPSSSSLPSSSIIRIQHELRGMMRDPVPFIYVSADESNVTKITALIIGPLETPYAGGFFRFDMRVVPEYPMKPPKVTFETTDGGRVRFNPNLYDDGNVCLSILGTWPGPAWSSAESLSSVLLSIQSLMCPQPYHNEPGFESRGDPETKQAYNDYIRYETLRVAVVSTMKTAAIAKRFPDVYDRLFLLWYEMYMSMANDLLDRRQGKSYNDPFSPRKGKYNITPIIEGLVAVKADVMTRMQALDHLPGDEDNDVFPSNSNCKSSLSYAVDRLQDDYRHLLRNPHPGGSASPRDLARPLVWDATILGPENTPWEGGLFSLEIRFSNQHPSRPPFARFTTKMIHPNITTDGVPALDLIQTRWNSNTRVGTILDELQKMLASPNSVYPVNIEIARLHRDNKREYERRIRRLAQDGC